jgi:cardiolipin synthase
MVKYISLNDLTIVGILLVLLHLVFIVRAMVRPEREPASRVAWLLVLLLAPIVGVIAYLMLGETNVGVARRKAEREAMARLPAAGSIGAPFTSDNSDTSATPASPLFALAGSIDGYRATEGNAVSMPADSDAVMDGIVADIDAATQQVHCAIYIWLDDNNGTKLMEALKRAAQRGVTCRVMADAFGSRALRRSPHWQAMRDAGINLVASLRINTRWIIPIGSRVDLRDHRKIIAIDGRLTWCGSQNAADAAFRVKPKFAPWVDTMARFVGPVAAQMDHLFASSWTAETGEDLTLLPACQPQPAGSARAIVVGTGPTARHHAMSEIFVALIYSARRELIITTPYFVPDDAMMDALRACARRGVPTTMILPKRNDSQFVGLTSRSHYASLLGAGVRILEFRPGLLHAKTMTVDGEHGMIGSANMDLRSFDLNYENNILFEDRAFAEILRDRQLHFATQADEVKLEQVRQWSVWDRFWANAAAMLSPLL